LLLELDHLVSPRVERLAAGSLAPDGAGVFQRMRLCLSEIDQTPGGLDVLTPVWMQVRRQLAHQPIVAGAIAGPNPLFAERYLFQDIERTVSGLRCTGLVTQFGGSRVREGEPGQWRSMNLPTQSLLIPRGVPTRWHYSGAVDFAVFYFHAGGDTVLANLEALARSRGAPLTFSDPLVGAAALQLVEELQKGAGADEGFMERVAQVMLEQTYRALVAPGAVGISPRHVHFARLQAVLNLVRDDLAGDLSVARLAASVGLSEAHFCRIFREATGVPPHRYVLAARLDLARNLLTRSTLPIVRIASECGFSSQSHLTASFRSAHSVTPARFREHVRKSRG
jgi:AraC family transcriptional regulator